MSQKISQYSKESRFFDGIWKIPFELGEKSRDGDRYTDTGFFFRYGTRYVRAQLARERLTGKKPVIFRSVMLKICETTTKLSVFFVLSNY